MKTFIFTLLIASLATSWSLALAEPVLGSFKDKAQIHQIHAKLSTHFKQHGLSWLDKLVFKEMGGGFTLRPKGTELPPHNESAQIMIGNRRISHHKRFLKDVFLDPDPGK